MARVGSYVRLALICTIGASLSGCTPLFQEASIPAVSEQTLEYYPRQVKGYQNSYPPRRILIMSMVEAREFKDPTAADHDPDSQGNPRIGVVLGRDRQAIQRIYGQPIGPIVQRSLAGAAQEAGMVPFASDDSLDAALKETGMEYVLASKLTRCWVKKERGTDSRYSPRWATSAEFSIDVVIYKPPFHTAFWQGTSSSSYDDPPRNSLAYAPEDDTSIYDEPGQVLSVALTRAVAGVFRRADLRSLILDDIVLHH